MAPFTTEDAGFCPILFFLSAPVFSLVRAFTSSSIKSNVLLLGLAIVVCTTSGRVSSRHFRYGREFCSGVCSCFAIAFASSVISALIHVRTSLRPLEFETVDMDGTRPLWWPRRLFESGTGQYQLAPFYVVWIFAFRARCALRFFMSFSFPSFCGGEPRATGNLEGGQTKRFGFMVG